MFSGQFYEKWVSVLERNIKLLLETVKLHSKKRNNWPMVSFIHNGSEITTWM